MITKSSWYVVFTAICCFIACIGDFAVTYIIGLVFKQYDPLNQSESFLGAAGSPVAAYMNAWEIIFSILFVLYAYGLRRTIFNKGVWQHAVVWLIVVYGLGEGIGSGAFPFNHAGGVLTFTGKMHLLFSTIGVLAMVVASFVLLKVFPKQLFPKIHAYALFVAVSGPAFIILFLLAKQHIIPLKGLWQRLFILDYYSLLIVITIEMLITHFKKTKHGVDTPLPQERGRGEGASSHY